MLGGKLAQGLLQVCAILLLPRPTHSSTASALPVVGGAPPQPTVF